MVSFWWLLAAFLGGGYAGLLLAALMRMSGETQESLANPSNLKRLQLP